MTTCRPTYPCELATALRTVSDALGEGYAYRVGARFYFPLADRLYLAVSPDDAGRVRVETCYGTRPIATLWAGALDRDRLAGLAGAVQTELAALAA